MRRTGLVFAVAAIVRAAIVVWAFGRFPAVADGEFYHLFAGRLASGLGYTMQWGDGAVTYAAHYPVGYPAILSVAYRLFGADAGVAMVVNAALGALASAGAHRLALREMSPRLALAAGLVVALHPALLLYTPALMTEGVTASLLMIALSCVPRTKNVWRLAAAGLVFGIATLVRPQVIVLAPLLTFAFAPRRARVLSAAVVLALALLTVAPWTIRNCARMNRCALVSMNGGWNLLIGIHTQTGGWTELEAPEGCKTVWDEAEKDACFEHAARSQIAAAPMTWLAKAPRKMAATFDVFAAGSWYLNHSNAHAFGERAVIASVGAELLVTRVLLIAALVASAPIWRVRVALWRWRLRAAKTPRRQERERGYRALSFFWRLGGLAASLPFACSRMAWPAYAMLAVMCLVRGKGERRSPIRMATGILVAATMVTHAVFFGAGRYGLLVVPLVSLAAFACVRPKALSASLGSSSGR